MWRERGEYSSKAPSPWSVVVTGMFLVRVEEGGTFKRVGRRRGNQERRE